MSERAKALPIDEIARLKAHELNARTGLPSIGGQSGWSVEPSATAGGGKGRTAAYHFNHVSDEIDKVIAQLRMFGEKHRTATYFTSMCYFDGETE